MTVKTLHRFEARTVADATRKARQTLGDEVVILSVNLQNGNFIPGTREPMVEIAVIQTDKIGIPSLLEYYKENSANVIDAQDLDSFPARYRILWDQLLQTGMRADQATILCREAWVGDPEFKKRPWHRILTILEHDVPCDKSIGQSGPLILGLAGERGTGRSTAARLLCQQTGAVAPGRVALVSDATPDNAEELGYRTFGMLPPNRVARALAEIEDLSLAVIDLPAVTPAKLGFHLIPWLNGVAGLKIVPTVTTGEVAAGVTLIHALKEYDALGFIMTHVDGPEALGVVINLAMATRGPLGLQGGPEGQQPTFEIAVWRTIVRRMMNHTSTVQVPADGGQERG